MYSVEVIKQDTFKITPTRAKARSIQPRPIDLLTFPIATPNVYENREDGDGRNQAILYRLDLEMQRDERKDKALR